MSSPSSGSPASSAIDVTFVNISREAVWAAVAITYEAVPLMRFLPWLGGFLILVGAFGPLGGSGNHLGGLIPVGMGTLLLLIRFLIEWSVRQSFHQQPLANKTIEWHVTRGALHFRSANGEATILWSALNKVRETKHGFLLFSQARMAHWLPRSALVATGSLDLFRRFVEANRENLGRGDALTAEPASSPEPEVKRSTSDECLRATYINTWEEFSRGQRAFMRYSGPWARYRVFFATFAPSREAIR